ncbi:cytochrome P450 [Spiractinospora alimapuensis]|uniref:cytochrome P450 n=1 Tax=Spiractinospora alimapuensis TaxID=2820884 RepID=UPI001F42BCA0|nr:cytochrome P450 [Spiractinospora alimapuensis]QVQ51208.1 cytochrome P450 [Spiractinospora alimapuensis]
MAITTHAQVRDALTCPSEFEVPRDHDGSHAPHVHWLRTHVVRFCDGQQHSRRRAAVTTMLTNPSTTRLRERAATYAEAALTQDIGWADGIRHVARTVPVRVLAEELGFTGDVTEDVRAVARVYHPHTVPDTAADAAVARLVRAGGGGADEDTAARIGLMIQACDATAALIENVADRWEAWRATDAPEAFLTEVLRHDPPVRLTRRRVTAKSGRTEDPGLPDVVELDLGSANRDPDVFNHPEFFWPERPDADRHLSFGAGPHQCPGEAQARALTVGALQGIANRKPR